MSSYYSYEDKSDTEYKIEVESSNEESSDYSYSDKEIKKSNSKRRTRQRSSSARRILLEWEEEDEIIVLTKLYEFSGNNASYSNPFYEYVKNRLRNKNNSHVSMNEMSNKIDGLKKEYLENESRRKRNELKFSGPHQWEVFVLSKRIWGADDNNNSKGGAGGKMKNLKGFMEFLREMEIDVNCLMPSCLEYLKKDWQVQLLMYNQLLSNKSKFDAKLRALVFNSKSHLK